MTKDQVLSILKAKENYVSGEAISRELGVSRAAVNGAIKALRSEGYRIDSATNRGYRLASSPDLLTPGELAPLLPPGRMERVLCLDTVGSTNDYLRGLALKGAPAGQVVIADGQSAGRGRLGRSFSSPKGKGVYLSLLLRPELPPYRAASLTAWAAVAIAGALKLSCGVDPGVKWVNDVVLGGRKLCGILTEMSVEAESGRIQYIILGVGVNVSQSGEDFPPDIRSTATSLYRETGRSFSRAALAAGLIRALDEMAARWPRDKAEYLEEYRRLCVTTGRTVVLHGPGTQREAFAEGIGEDFGLTVRYPDGSRETLTSGEVSVRGTNGYL